LQILDTVVLVNLIKCLLNIRFFLTTYRVLVLITLISDLYWVYHLTKGSSRSFGAAMCLCCKGWSPGKFISTNFCFSRGKSSMWSLSINDWTQRGMLISTSLLIYCLLLELSSFLCDLLRSLH